MSIHATLRKTQKHLRKKCTIIYNIHGHFIGNALTHIPKTKHTHTQRGENLPSLMVLPQLLAIHAQHNKMNDN